VVRNCPWNKCAFCPAYKNEKFSIRDPREVIAEIELLAKLPENQNAAAVFLQDGDALSMPVDKLVPIIAAARTNFPNAGRITAYSRSSTLAVRKTGELRRLREAGLSRVHVGMESGSDDVLKFIRKGVTAAQQLNGCLNAKAAGLELCCYLMPGIGGKKYSAKHALESGRLLAQIDPAHIRLRSAFVLEGTPLADEYLKGNFQPLTELETVLEIQALLKELKNNHSEIVSDHRINLLLELNGRLPEDHQKLQGIINQFLALNEADKELFIAGRRLGLIRVLKELSETGTRAQIEKEKHRYKVVIPAPIDLLY